MKYFYVYLLLLIPSTVYAAEPSTSCPSGYVAIEEEYMDIADGSCPSGYTSAGTADSCLISSPDGSCIMYAPANTEYSDDVGAYKFIVDCPME